MTGDIYRNPGDGLNHATRFDPEYGIASKCGIRGRGIEWEQAAGPVEHCNECRALVLLDGVLDARRDRIGRHGGGAPEPKLLELHPKLLYSLCRSRVGEKAGVRRVDLNGDVRLLGAVIAENVDLPDDGWRLLDVAGEGTV
jgi:hypothetical protein